MTTVRKLLGILLFFNLVAIIAYSLPIVFSLPLTVGYVFPVVMHILWLILGLVTALGMIANKKGHYYGSASMAVLLVVAMIGGMFLVSPLGYILYFIWLALTTAEVHIHWDIAHSPF